MARRAREKTAAEFAPEESTRPGAKAFAEIAARSKSFRPARDVLRRVRAVPTIFPALDWKLRVGGWPIDRTAMVHGPSGMGKALAHDELVLTPVGWEKISKLRIGDLVIGADGDRHRVMGVFDRGQKQLYRVTFSDRCSIECCDEHLWKTSTFGERQRGKFARGSRPKRDRIPTGVEGGGSVKSLSEIRDGFVPRDHQIPTVQPVRYAEIARSLPINPYLMGLLLGDGSFVGSTVTFSKPEQDVVDALEKRLPDGDRIRRIDAVSVAIIKCGKRTNQSRSRTSLAIESCGLSRLKSVKKFIPDVYMRASVDDRRELLRGLFDTDGYVTSGGRQVEFSSSSSRLADDVAELARSLGGLVTRDQARSTKYTYEGETRVGQESYRMRVSFPEGVCPVGSLKHLSRWKGRCTPLRRTIVSIVPSRVDRAICIAVDAPDRLFVARDFIVTHNTQLVQGIGLSFLRRGHMFAFIDAEMTTPMPWLETLFGSYADDPRFIASRPSSYEQAVDDVQRIATGVGDAREKGRIPKETTCFFAVDSIGKLSPIDILEKVKKHSAESKDGSVGGMNGMEGAYKAALNKMWLDRLIPLMHDTGCAIAFVARESDDRNASANDRKYGNDWKTTGGSSLYYDASLDIRVAHAKMIHLDEDDYKSPVVGELHTIEVRKTKVSARESAVERTWFSTSNGALTPAGFDRTRDLVELGCDLGVIKQAGAWYSFGGRRWQGKSRILTKIEPHVLDAIESECRAKFGAEIRSDIVGTP